ncbi:9111_t:CDS:2, partial [Dentiscutata erythropus]
TELTNPTEPTKPTEPTEPTKQKSKSNNANPTHSSQASKSKNCLSSTLKSSDTSKVKYKTFLRNTSKCQSNNNIKSNKFGCLREQINKEDNANDSNNIDEE